MNNELILKVSELNNKKKELERLIDESKSSIDKIESELLPLKESILNDMTTEDLKEYRNDGLVTFLCSTTSTGYTKDEETKILEILKDKNLNSCIKIKESLVKNELRKNLKSNESLRTLLENYGTPKTTKYIQVMTEEDALKRQESIESAKTE